MKLIVRKGAVAGLCYFAGSLLCAVFEPQLAPVLAAVGVILAVVVVMGVLRRGRVVCMGLFAAAIGAGVFTCYDYIARQPVLALAESGEETEITGRVTDKRELAFYNAVYTVETRVDGYSLRIQLTAPDSAEIEIGDTLTARAVLSEFRDTAAFPERSYNHAKGVLLRGEAESVALSGEQSRQTPVDAAVFAIRNYNRYISSEIARAYPGETGTLLRALFMGDKSALSDSQSRAVTVAGAAHFAAVSGLHMTMAANILMLLWRLTPWAGNRRAKFAVLVCAAAVLAVFFGLSRSVVRAAFMLTICYGGELFLRKSEVVNSLGVAMLMILIAEPYAVTDPGLLMSFAGTLGMGFYSGGSAPAPPLKNLSEERFLRISKDFWTALNNKNPKVLGGPGDFFKSPPAGVRGRSPRGGVFIASTCSAVCVLPVAALYFGGTSALSPLTSVAVLPFFAVAVPAALGFAATAPLSGIAVLGAVPQSFLLIAGAMSRCINAVVAALGSVETAYIPLDYGFVPFWAAFAVLAVAAVGVITRAKLAKSAALTVAALAVMICGYNAAAAQSGRAYMEITSDGVAAVAVLRQSGREVVIVTADTRFAAETAAARQSADVVVLLNRLRNNESAFENLPGYIPPTFAGTVRLGEITLDIGEDGAVLETNGGDFRAVFTRASNESAPPANITILSGYVRNKRDFDSNYTIYLSKSIPVSGGTELCAAYDRLLFVFGRDSAPAPRWGTFEKVPQTPKTFRPN